MPASMLDPQLNDSAEQERCGTPVQPQSKRKRCKSNPPAYKTRGLVVKDHKSPNAEPDSVLIRYDFGTTVVVNKVLSEWTAKRLAELESKSDPQPKPRLKSKPKPKPVFRAPYPPQPPRPPQPPQPPKPQQPPQLQQPFQPSHPLYAPVAIRPHRLPTPPSLTPPLTPRIPEDVLRGLYPNRTILLPPSPVFYQPPIPVQPAANPDPTAIQTGFNLDYLYKLVLSAQQSVVGPAFPLPIATPTPLILPPIKSEMPIIHPALIPEKPIPVANYLPIKNCKRKMDSPLLTPNPLQAYIDVFPIPEKRVKLSQPIIINNHEINPEQDDEYTQL